MPHIQKLYKELNPRGVEFLAVNSGDKAETIRAYFTKEKFGLTPVQQEKDEASKAYGVQVYPTNYLIGPDGRIAWRAAGFEFADLKAVLEESLRRK